MEKRKIVIISIFVLYFLSMASALAIIFSRKQEASLISMGRYKIPTKIITENSIGVVNVFGPISMGQKTRSIFSGGSEDVVKRIKAFGEKSEIKAIIMRINSPGGTVAATQEIYAEIMNQRAKGKVFVASIGDVGASGGYYIASACDKIVANPGSITGSIGVLLEVGNIKELFRKIGVKMETVKSGRYKDSGSAYRDMDIEERKIFQNLVDDAYEQFVNSIVEGRKMEREKVLQLADGRIYTGAQAFKAGLVDKLGDEKTAIDLAVELAKIPGKPKIIEDYEPWEQILSILGQSESSSPVEKVLAKGKFRLEYVLE